MEKNIKKINLGGVQIYPSKSSEIDNDLHFITKSEAEALVTPTTPNVIKFGGLIIEHGQMYEFSESNYAQFPFLVDLTDKEFVITMEFTTNDNVNEQQNILDSNFGLAFAVRNQEFVLAVSENGTSWAFEAVGGKVNENTTYLVKIERDAYQYFIEYSTDNGETWEVGILEERTFTPYPRTVIIGKDLTDRYIFNGSINLNKCTLSVNNQYIWDGMTDAGLLTRLDTSLSNIDANGVEYIKSLGGDTKIKPITFAEYEALEDKSGVYFVIPDSL